MLWKMLHAHRIWIIPAALSVYCLLAAGCAPVALPPAGARGQGAVEQNALKGKPELKVEDLEQRTHQLVNEERVKHGLLPLAWNPTLSRIARRHSQDMMKRNYFGHYSPEGHDPSYRYAEQGFVCKVDAGAMTFTGAENVFQNNLYDTVEFVNEILSEYRWVDLETIARTTVKGWMSSPGHRRNILEPSCKTEGIGVAISNDHKVYITEDFC